MKVYLRANGSYCLLAEMDANVAGFILTELAPDEGHIVTLDVVENYRHRGIGSLLLATAEKEAASRGGKRMVLETATTNEAAIALWRKHGYRQVGTIQDYYGKGRDAFRMVKQVGATPAGTI